MGSPSSSVTSAVAVATRLRDEALAAAQTLEEEAASLASIDAARSQQIKEDAILGFSSVRRRRS
jgi:hypothetical protein